MLIAEAEWIGSVLEGLPDEAFPLANIGCQTLEFRAQTQPWIDQYVFAPMEQRARKVVHVDIRNDPGVDVIADVMSDGGMALLRSLDVRTLLCSNLLEHVEDPIHMVRRLAEAVPLGGYLIVTGPQEFPYHADPIDNMFRPSWEEVAKIVGNRLVVMDGRKLQCRRLGYYFGLRTLGRLRLAARLAVPFYKPSLWWERVSWLARRPTQYCLFFHRPLALLGERQLTP